MLFIIGTIFASFTQAIAYRYAQQTQTSHRSMCHHCHQQLYWYHLIPILSYILTTGKCTFCKKRIPFYYPCMECLGGLLALFLPHCNTSYTLILIAFFIFAQIDLEYQIVPNIWQGLYFIVTLLYCAIPHHRFYISILMLFLYVIIDKHLPNKIGGADVKLLLITYLNIGMLSTMYILLYASIFALLYMCIKHRFKQSIAFVPFLCLGACLHSYLLFIHNLYPLIH
ncbi:hypothetical protein GMA11_03855 [Granulicatella sp. zg-ZJ]|uniref:prepilin peptidase n=1 Tax=Granulicatella sp. zg-ZJ TaxID=2678504 RepID=UPI0013D188D5|nr:A24 family peptidase [Granulicatella sp. zg-ZJ]NEW62523.1 hypothetical protein [Granulicatella sp. zg-ZJ]